MRLNWQELSKEEKIAVVRVGAAKKMSASEIAAELDNCTRNAVIGLASRNGIKLNGTNAKVRKEAVQIPKTGLKTRPLMPLRAVKSKQRKAKPSTAPKLPAKAVKGSTDWRSLSAEGKAEYVRYKTTQNLSAREIADSILNATIEGVKSCAKRNKIKLLGNSAEARKARSGADLVPALPSRKAEKPDWIALSAAAKVALLKRSIAAGYSVDIIAASVKNATEAAVRRCAERNKLKLPPKTKAYVNILDIGDMQCRNPMWEDKPPTESRDVSEFVFCGKPVQIGSRFCPACHSRIWRPIEEEQRVSRRQAYQGYAR